ncbi:MAG: 50S ribosomal protein L25 [bacterium]
MKVSLQAKVRDLKEKPNQSRAAGYVPAVMYGHEQPSVALAVKKTELEKVYQQAGESTLVDLTVADLGAVKVLIHDIQFDPVKSNILHVDFYKVNMKEKIHAEVPIHFTGVSPAVKDLGGTLLKLIDKLSIECLPQDLLSEIIVDISSMTNFDKAITVTDLKLPETIQVRHHNVEDIVAKVERPRSEAELAALNEEVKVDVSEVEVEKKGKEEEEGSEVKAEEPKKEEKK